MARFITRHENTTFIQISVVAMVSSHLNDRFMLCFVVISVVVGP